MCTEESTIEILQNRIKYLEAHLHLALQILNEIENDSPALESKDPDLQILHQHVESVTIAKPELPMFLNSRSWKHDIHLANLNNFRDRLVARAS